jgi:hypothetical protein
MHQHDGRPRERAGRLVVRRTVDEPGEPARGGGAGAIVQLLTLAATACRAIGYWFPRAFRTSSVRRGRISNRSPTRP